MGKREGISRLTMAIIVIIVVIAAIIGVYVGFILPTQKVKAKPIPVGFIGPFSGPAAYNGEEMKRGAILAVEEVNAKGGINGRNITLIFGDTESKPSVGAAVVRKLIEEDKVYVIGGGYHSSVNLVTTEVAQKYKTPIVIAVAITPDITKRGFDYVFRTTPNASQFLIPEVTFIMENLRPKNCAALLEDTDYGRSSFAVWKKVAEKYGCKVLDVEYFEIGQKDFTTAISKLKSFNPQVTFVVASTTEGALILKQAKALDFNTQIATMGGMMTPAFFKMAGKDANYIIANGLDPNLMAAKRSIAKDFVRKYVARWGVKPRLFAAQAYDNMLVIIDALKRANLNGDLQSIRKSIRDALRNTSIEGVTGHIEFDKTGQEYTIKVNVIQIQPGPNGEPTPQIIWPPELATSKYIPPPPWKERE